MDLVLVGLNHKTAPIEIRERVAFGEGEIPAALSMLHEDYGFGEAMILSTCNRVEICAGGSDNADSVDRLKDFLCSYHSLERSYLEQYLYVSREQEMVHHVFRVASSLDSMVPGESQILGQMKRAYSLAKEADMLGSSILRLIQHAFFVAKRVRSETQIASAAVSISSVAVELARKIFGELDNRSILLLGAGKMAELAAQAMLNSGVTDLCVANRTLERAKAIAEKFRGRTVPFEDVEKTLVESDIVLVSTGAEKHVLDKPLMDRVIQQRKYKPLFLIDISVPRNVAPDVNDLENVFLYDIDDFQSVVSANLKEREREAELAEAIILQEAKNFEAASSISSHVGPVVSSLRKRIESICLEEIAKTKNGFDEQQLQQLEKIVLRAAHRIAHPLMVQIKKGHDNPSRQFHNLEMIKEAFELEEQDETNSNRDTREQTR